MDGIKRPRQSRGLKKEAVNNARHDTSTLPKNGPLKQIIPPTPATSLKQKANKIARWWIRHDRTNRLRWRLTNAAAALLILSTVALPIVQQQLTNRRYRLSANTLDLVGKHNPALSSKLTFNTKTQTYEFNKQALKQFNPTDPSSMQVGSADDKTKSLYSLDVPTDPKKGVTYHDVNSQLSFTLVPQFDALPAKTEQGRIVMPLPAGSQAVYTLKNSGLKEDIVVPKAKQATMRFSYTLNIPKSLEARQLPNNSGAIGLYSADPTLFSNMSYGSDKDRDLIEKARENAAKTNLVFGIPAPVITTPDGKLGQSQARFELRDNQLTVVAEKLTSIKGAFSIDPSVTITSTTDFNTGNNEGNIDFSTSGQINRGTLTGGTVPSWISASAFTQASYAGKMIAYNGYMYLLSGQVSSGTKTNSVQYAAINSGTGNIGTWNYTHNSTNDGTTFVSGFNLVRADFSVAVYNGYIYVVGGNNGSTVYSDVQYARLNGDGTVGTWTTDSDSAMASGRFGFGLEVYNGRLYAFGGCSALSAGTCSSTLSNVERVTFNADGSLNGAWTTTGNGSMTTTRFYMASATYNGYLYSTGGCVSISLGNCTSTLASVEYAPINSDGSVGTWVVTTSFTTGRQYLSSGVYNGYLYIMGGGSFLNDVQYAEIYANGSLGTWQTTTAFTTARQRQASVAYNGYLYMGGGCTSATANCGSGLQNDVQYAKIDDVANASAYTNSANTFTTNRVGVQAVAYNGFLYAIGGFDGTNAQSSIYAAAINADGSLGTFTNTGMTALPVALSFSASVAYNGYMYVLGGCTSVLSSCTTAANNVSTVYKSAIASNGTLGAWSTETAFTTARYGLTSVAYNGFLYMLGGANGNASQPAIQYHAIGASGAISGAWTTSSFTLTTNYPSATVYGGYLYVAGGCSSANSTQCLGGATSSVYYARLTAAGDLANALTSTNVPANPRGGAGLVANNGYLYIIGGFKTTTGPTVTVYYSDTLFAPINSNGSVGTWQTSAASVLATARFGVGAAAYNGKLYVLGGANGSTYYNNTQIAQINNGGGGSVLGWTNTGMTNLPVARSKHGVVAYNGYLYVLGGRNNSNSYLSTVLYSPITSTGNGAWTQTTNYDTTNNDQYVGYVAYAGYMYKIAGDGSSMRNDVQFAPICTAVSVPVASCTAAGALGTWQYTWSNTSGVSQGGGLATARDSFSVAVYNGRLYVAGGCTHRTVFEICDTLTNTVETAAINAADGTVGAWSTIGTNLPGNRYRHQMVAYNGYIYVISGCDTFFSNTNNACGSYTARVDYALATSTGLASDAGCGAMWCRTADVPTARSFFAAYGYDGYLYILGGQDSSANPMSDVSYAPINSNGTLGNWKTSLGYIPTARSTFGAGAAYDGKFYVIGGCSITNDNNNCGTSTLTDAEQAAPQVIPRIGRYSKLIDFGRNINLKQLTYNGVTSELSSVKFEAADSTGVFGSSSTASSIAATGVCTGNFTLVRYILVLLNFDDSQTATYGEASGSTITDFTVNYNYVHPPPNIRLKLGQTLQQGDLSPFDTCGTLPY